MQDSTRGFRSTLESLLLDPVQGGNASKGKLNILMVGTEAAPYASVGGFAYVLGYLSQALADLGHDVRLFIPKFFHIDEDEYEIEMLYEGLEIPTGDESNPFLVCNIKTARKSKGVPVYFLENQEYYEKRANIYGYNDDSTRWALLSKGVLEFIRTRLFVPDVVHCNDWHTGAVANYLKTIYKKDPVLKNIASVFTIHNMKFQGLFDHMNVPELDMDDGYSQIAPFFSERLIKQNFLRRGILYADAVNTVSTKYSKEVLTPEYGEGLDKLLLELKGKFFGIVNGIDFTAYDPRTDNLLAKNYSIGSLENRRHNKRALQKEFDLRIDDTIPLFGYVGRLDHQKGVDLIINTMHHVLRDFDIQFMHVGGGDAALAKMVNDLKTEFPEKVGVHPYPNFTLPRLMFAGTDVIMVPSRFEPCGVVQLEAMRYGAVPIVRGVGGLADTVTNFNSSTYEGNGFVFKEFNEFGLFGQIVRAIELMNHPNIWTRIQKNAMKSDYSWEYSAKEYDKLYHVAMSLH